MIELLKKVNLFSTMNEKQLLSISNCCVLKNYKAGTILFREKEMGSIFYIVVAGTVKVYTSNEDGEEKILNIFSDGEAFGELALLDGKPRSATAEAVEDTKVLSLTAHDFTGLLRSNFEITQGIIKELCSRLRETNQHVYDLTFLDVKQRVVKNLVRLAAKYGRREGDLITIHMKLNYAEISQMASVPQNMLFQVFKDLQNKHILQLNQNEIRLNLARINLVKDGR